MNWFWRTLAILCGLAAGIFVILPNFIRTKYGSTPARLARKIKLEDFSYSPASPVRYGTDLIFQARVSKARGYNIVSVNLGDQKKLLPGSNLPYSLWLHDDGNPPDYFAGDGVYASELVGVFFPSEGVVDLPVTCTLEWRNDVPEQQLSGPPLTVLPAEEEAQ